MNAKALLKTIRPPFLVITPVCVLLGVSTSLATSATILPIDVAMVLLGALFAHVAVNTLNEYFDFKSGLDFRTKKTAFSGGSGALPDNPEMAASTLAIGLASVLLTVVIGIYFIVKQGAQILPVGVLGLVLVATYTQWLNRLPLLCLIAPGLGFGVLMVLGTHIVLGGSGFQRPLLVSLVPFFLINNLLLLNQYPDIKADAQVGRRTFPVVFGLRRSNVVYAVFMSAAYLCILLLVALDDLPTVSLVAMTPLFFSVLSLVGAIKHASNIGDYPQYLASNVAASVLTPLLLGGAIIYGL